MFKNSLTLNALAAALLLTGATFTTTGCSQADRQETASESDRAYNDFQTFVTNTETNAEKFDSDVEADYDEANTRMKADYDTRLAAVEKYNDRYDDARRQEIEALRTRYTTAYDKRTAAWNRRLSSGEMTLGQYYKPSNPAGQLTAANARSTYEQFIRNVKQNQERYDINDWRNINSEWRALDEAYDKVKGDISAKDLAEIQKEKLKYAAFKSWDKTKIRAGQGADAVSGEAQELKAETADERSKVGRAVSNTASDVKEAGKDVGRGAANAGKKVGGAVKDVFDGKDDKDND
ncbi:hypothetical protein GCM10023185_05670 [Hymenobacter saemangeumensis]|uniref:Lipoprotein n=1 Tax=Hymenobacter saemangeumensis TaxID=1084522 RepID=A0ABP8I155_9BACT